MAGLTRWLFALGLVVAVGTSAFTGSARSAGRPSCLVSNQRTGVGYRSLQDAIDAAASGDTLIVKGTCVGTSLIGGASGDVTNKDLTLHGVSNKHFGAATLDGGGSSNPVLTVSSYEGPNVAISDLTISHGGELGIYCQGAVALTRAVVRDNGATGIYGSFCTLSVTNSVISGNGSSGIVQDSGGGLRMTGSSVRDNGGCGLGGGRIGQIVSDSTITGNAGCGVGIGDDGSLYISSSTISGNSGPGALMSNGSLSLVGSTVSGNTASSGGGIDAYYFASVSVTDSVITGNSATLDGGGINVSLASGVSVDNSMVSGNTAGRYGGGIAVGTLGSEYSGLLLLKDSTVRDNTASSGGGLYVGESPYNDVTLAGANTFVNNAPENCVGISGC